MGVTRRFRALCAVQANPPVYLPVGGKLEGLSRLSADAVVIHRVRERSRGYANMSEVEAALAHRSNYNNATFRSRADVLRPTRWTRAPSPAAASCQSDGVCVCERIASATKNRG